MSRFFSLICTALLLTTTALAQHSFKATIVDHESGDPLIGVTVYIPELDKGNSTNDSGFVEINNIPTGAYELVISYVGYENYSEVFTFPLIDETVKIIELHHGHEELGEIVVNSTRSSRTIEDSPTRVEFIDGEELSEKGNMKPGDIRMLLNESTGIQTQQTSAISYNSSIRIQGLDGKYTQLHD